MQKLSEEVEIAEAPVLWRGAFCCAGREVHVELQAREKGLVSCRLSLGGEIEADAVPPELHIDGPASCHIREGARQLEEYFRGKRTFFDVPLHPEAATPFQQGVWRAALTIPFAQTRSYWWVAVRLGNPYAARAVGGALGANPLPLFVPCHRVVRADGHAGGFTPDPELKQVLLGHELEVGGLEPRFSV